MRGASDTYPFCMHTHCTCAYTRTCTYLATYLLEKVPPVFPLIFARGCHRLEFKDKMAMFVVVRPTGVVVTIVAQSRSVVCLYVLSQPLLAQAHRPSSTLRPSGAVVRNTCPDGST